MTGVGPFRAVWKYELVQVEMKDLKKGDLFRIMPLDPDDKEVDEMDILIACTDPVAIDDPRSTHEIQGVRLIPDPTYAPIS